MASNMQNCSTLSSFFTGGTLNLFTKFSFIQIWADFTADSKEYSLEKRFLKSFAKLNRYLKCVVLLRFSFAKKILLRFFFKTGFKQSCSNIKASFGLTVDFCKKNDTRCILGLSVLNYFFAFLSQ